MNSAIVVDVDEDGIDELLLSRQAKKPQRWGITLTDASLTSYWQCWFDYPTEALGIEDVDGDGEVEVLAREKRGDTAYLLYYSLDGELENRLKVIEGQDLNPSSGWDGWIGFDGSLETAGKRVLVLSVGTSLDLQPRGVLTIDPRTGEILWSYPTGFYVGDVVIEDLDDDEDAEIVLGSMSPANGSVANGTDDAHTYVVVLNHQGKRLWKKQIGGSFSKTKIRVTDFQQDGMKEIVVMEETERVEHHYPDRLMIVEGSTGRIRHSLRKGEAFRGLAVCDLDGDSIPEIITGNTDGLVRVFDRMLEETDRYEYEGELKIAGVSNFDDDPRGEILVTTRDGKLLVLNSHLEEIGNYQIQEGYHLYACPVNTGERKAVLVSFADPNGRSEMVMLAVSDRPFIYFDLPIVVFIPLVILVFLFLSLMILFCLKHRRLFKGILTHPSTGIILLNARGRIRGINRRGRRLLGLDEQAKVEGKFCNLRIVSPYEDIQKTICGELIQKKDIGEREVKIIEDDRERIVEITVRRLGLWGIVIILNDVTEREFGRKATSWAPLAQQLAHGIKNPLSHIKMVIQRLAKLDPAEPKSKRYLDIGMEDVDRVLKLTDGFMRFTKLEPLEKKPCRIENLVEDICSRLRPTLPEKVAIETRFETDLPLINLDKDQIGTMLDHLLDNAVSAVGEEGLITVKISFLEKLDSVKFTIPCIEIRVSDNGTGIPSRYISKIFEPYFSLKEEGTGLGLVMVKKIVEDHQGKIEVESKPGLGTTFIITLPVERRGK